MLLNLARIAGQIGSDGALVPVLDLLHSKTSGVTGESREEVVGGLTKFKQERATQELHTLLSDPDATIQTIAAQSLAERTENNDGEIRSRAATALEQLRFNPKTRVGSVMSSSPHIDFPDHYHHYKLHKEPPRHDFSV